VAPVTAANNRALIELGVQQVGLQRDGTPGKARQEYERSRPFQRMRNWRVGVKARISHLKRGLGFRRASLTLLTWTVPVAPNNSWSCHALRSLRRPVPALPSWLAEPLWDQFATLLPEPPVYHPDHPFGCHRRPRPAEGRPLPGAQREPG
jgi:hypothetical protein